MPVTFSELVRLWLVPPTFPAPSFPIAPREFTLTLGAVPLEGFPAERYPEVLGAHKTVACYEWPGDGPTLVLAHGWGGCAAQFAGWIKPLTQAGYHVLSYDAPAHGASEGTLASAPANAATLKALIEWQGKPVHGIIGHSLGAIATTLALAAGVPVTQAIFLAPICYVSDGLKNHGLRHGLTDSEADGLVAYFQAEFSTDLSLLTALARVSSPPPLTLFHDRADESVPFAEAETIAAHWPGAQLVEVPRVGHTRILLARGVIQQALSVLAG
nr:alpha/beta hydrolase family protein [Armatimonas rosea]